MEVCDGESEVPFARARSCPGTLSLRFGTVTDRVSFSIPAHTPIALPLDHVPLCPHAMSPPTRLDDHHHRRPSKGTPTTS